MDASYRRSTRYTVAVATGALSERLFAEGPKRILALDGGGIRALIMLGYLERIEGILRDRSGRRDSVLADYFDLIGGTSTGSIVAVCLSLGWDVARIRRMYRDLGHRVFRLRKHWLGPVARLLGPKFDETPLEEILRGQFGERTLGSDDLRTGLAVIAKRADTGSVWVILNNPKHKYFASNRDLPLWRIVRASTAAPPFFRPTHFADVGFGEPAAFVDGGVSMHLNPALQMFMVATLEGFALRWPVGEDRLLLCSVGTGSAASTAPHDRVQRLNNVQLLVMLMSQIIRDSSELNQTLLQWISRSPTASTIDSQIGSLGNDLLTPQPLLTYLRYNVELTKSALNAIGIDADDAQASLLRAMASVANIDALESIGAAGAASQVASEHFPTVFDRGASR